MATNSNRRAVYLGVFIVLSIAILMVTILTIGNLHNTFSKKIQLSAIFDDVNGLLIGSNVWFSGVKVGTVESMEFYGQSQVKVVLVINTESVPFVHNDATVKVGSDGLIGSKIIVISGGTQTAPHVEDQDVLQVEKVLSTETMLNTLQENNNNILAITNDFKVISKQITEGKGTLGKLLYQDDLYTSIGTSLATLERTTAKADKLAAELASYSSKLNTGDGLANTLATDTVVFAQIQSAVKELQKITTTAGDITTNLKQVSAQLQQKDSPAGLLLNDEATANTIKSTILNLESSSKKLDEDLEALQSNFLLRKYFKKKDKAAVQP